MIAPCMSGMAMPRLSNTAFNGLNCGRDRMRSNRCCSVSLAAGGLAADVTVSGALIIKFSFETILEPARQAGTSSLSFIGVEESMNHLRLVPEFASVHSRITTFGFINAPEELRSVHFFNSVSFCQHREQ